MRRFEFALLNFVCGTALLRTTRSADAPSTSTSSNVLSVPLPAAPPNNAQPLVSTHLSFSLEQDRWPEWVGVDAPNQFTLNALTNLQAFTGSPPKIRVGANSEDHTTWSSTVDVVEASFPPPTVIKPYPEASQITVGDRYYTLGSHLPRGTHMVWGVNFGADSPGIAADMARSITKAFAGPAMLQADVHLDLIEIGNEPDFYKGGFRPANWTVAEYVADWAGIAGAVVNASGIAGSGVGLVGAAFAGQGFTPTQIFNAGILNSAPGKLIAQISQHRYSAVFCNGGDFELASFMSKAGVRGNLTVFSADVQETIRRGLPYVMGETGSIACHGAPGVSNTAGIALWTIDYTLQAATLGMVEVLFHQGIGFKYNFWQPVALNRSIVDGSPLDPPQPPLVHPAYYGAVLIARLIGHTGSARVVELAVPPINGDADHVAGYAVYEDTRLARAVFVHLGAWLKSSTGDRPAVHLSLDFARGRKSGTEASVRRLVIEHADDTAGLLFGGQSYEANGDATVSGDEVLETVQIADGVDLRATEAVLITFR